MDAYVQQPPGPWDLPAKAPTFFVDGEQKMKVPYTSSMKVSYTNDAWWEKQLAFVSFVFSVNIITHVFLYNSLSSDPFV